MVARSGMRYRLGMEGIRWARTGDVTPKSPRDVMQIGDIVYVLPSGEGEALLAQMPEAQGAIVALDPHDGSIVALSGGFDYAASKFNRVTQARRQPGSSFKPFIYSAALEAGLTPATVVLDAPVVYEAPDAEVGIGQGAETAGRGRGAASRRTGAPATIRAAFTARRACGMRSRARATWSRSASCAGSASASRASTCSASACRPSTFPRT